MATAGAGRDYAARQLATCRPATKRPTNWRLSSFSLHALGVVSDILTVPLGGRHFGEEFYNRGFISPRLDSFHFIFANSTRLSRNQRIVRRSSFNAS